MRNRNRKGFTLIELLIVIAIIGILAVVLIPQLLGARQRAYDTAAQQCGRAVLLAAEAIRIDNQDANYDGLDPDFVRIFDANSCNSDDFDGSTDGVFTIDLDPTTDSQSFVGTISHRRGNTTFYATGSTTGGTGISTTPPVVEEEDG